MSNAVSVQTGVRAVLGVCVAAVAFLVWILYIKAPPAEPSDAFPYLPAVNATLNGISACCIALGFLAIKSGKKRIHMTLMISAGVVSALFLVSYITYHTIHGDTKFLGEGTIRFVYFFVLATHIGCTLFALPMILMTFFLAATRRFDLHKRLARYTLPLWLYVSITGVTIFLLLKVNS
jgi:putative membrane protein